MIDAPAPPPPARASWPAWTSVVALLAGLAIALVGGAVIGLAAAIAGASIRDPPPAVNILATVVQDLGLIAAAVIFARIAGRVSAADFGLRPTPVGRALGLVALAYVTFIAVSAAWVSALDIKSKDDLVDQLGGGKSTVALAAICVLVTVVAPIAEEFFFRGFFFQALRGRLGVWLAAIVTGLVFGAIHAFGSPVGFLVPLAFFGFVLCLVFWRTRSLYPCMALHCLNNSIAFGTGQHWGWEIPVVFVGSLAVIAAIVAPASRLGGGRSVAGETVTA